MNRGWALVTGGAKRLGRAAAERLAQRGFGVIVHYNASAAEAGALVAEIIAGGGRAVSVGADLGEAEAASGLIAAATQVAGEAPVVLINSASVFAFDTWDTLSEQGFSQNMAVNALAPALVAQAFAKALPGEARGVIVNFLDFKLAQPYPDHFSYTLSKYALMGATELLARALAPRVRVNAVAPGYVLPSPGQDEADFRRLHAQTPLERGATTKDIADAVEFLVQTPSVTAQTIYIDSGLRLRTHERDFTFQ